MTRIADQVDHMSHNNLALIADVISTFREVVRLLKGKGSTLSEFRDLISNWTKLSKKRRAKALANLRLSEQYGIKLTIRDISTLVQFWQSFAQQGDIRVARAATSYTYAAPYGTVSTEEHWKCFWSASRAYAPAIATLFRDDLIGFENLWDLIPYSFVVDWFAPVGEILQAWDDEAMLSKMSIDCISVGIKSTVHIRDMHEGWTYDTTASFYSRSKCSSFPPYAYTNSRDGISANVIINGAALIVQHL